MSNDIIVNFVNNIITGIFPQNDPKRSYKVLENLFFSVIPGYLFSWYLWKTGVDSNDKILQGIALAFFLADNYMMYQRYYDIDPSDEYFSNKLSKWFNLPNNSQTFGVLYMIIPALIFGTYIIWSGIKLNNSILTSIGLLILIVDLYHFLKRSF